MTSLNVLIILANFECNFDYFSFFIICSTWRKCLRMSMVVIGLKSYLQVLVILKSPLCPLLSWKEFNGLVAASHLKAFHEYILYISFKVKLILVAKFLLQPSPYFCKFVFVTANFWSLNLFDFNFTLWILCVIYDVIKINVNTDVWK
jgi:hypothetical protein